MRSFILGCLGVALTVAPASAQVADSSDVRFDTTVGSCLTLSAVMELARKTDPSVIVSRARELEADADIIEARSLWRPRVDTILRTGTGSTSVVNSGVSNSAGLRASQRLFDFGDAKYARQAARADFAASTADTRTAQINAARLAGLAVLNMREAEAQIAVTSERRAYFARQLDAVDAVLELGGATRTERASVALQLADADRFALELNFQKQEARAQVESFTEAVAPVCRTAGPVNLVGATAGFATADDAVRAAFANNPNLDAQTQRADALSARRERERRARLPVVDLVATGTYSSLNRFDDFRFRERVGIDITIPLYSGNLLGARRQRASARENVARGQILDIQRQLRTDVSIIWERLQSLRGQIRLRKDVREQARLQFEAAQIEQNAGTRTLRDLVEVRLEFEAAALAVVSAEFEMKRQSLQLSALLGTP